MTAQAFSNHSLPARSGPTLTGTAMARRPASDLLVEKVALGLLAWSDRRLQKNRITHERMALLLENERAASRSGSPLGR